MTEPCADCPPPEPQPAKRVVRVKVWYVDEDDQPMPPYVDPDWSELPEVGFQVGVKYHADGTREIMQGSDYYFRCGDVYGHTSNKTDLDKYPDAVVVRGKWIADDVYYGIVDQAMSDEG